MLVESSPNLRSQEESDIPSGASGDDVYVQRENCDHTEDETNSNVSQAQLFVNQE